MIMFSGRKYFLWKSTRSSRVIESMFAFVASREEKVRLAVQEPAPLAGLDRAGVVVALLHVLQRVALLDLETTLLEARRAHHVEEQIERRIEHAREAVERGPRLRAAHEAADVRGEKVHLLVELLGREPLRPALADHRPGEAGQAGLRGRLEEVAGADEHRHVDERQSVVLRHVHDDPVLELVLVLVGLGNLELQFLEREIGRLGRDVGGDGGGSREDRRGENHDHDAGPLHHLPPSGAAAGASLSALSLSSIIRSNMGRSS